MRILFLYLFSFALPAAALAAVNVQIEEVGLKGYSSLHFSTPVRVRLTSDRTEKIRLEFKVTNEDEPGERVVWTNKLALSVNVVANATMEMDVPVPFLGSNNPGEELVVTAFDAGSHSLGSSKVSLNKFNGLNRGELIAIVCSDRRLCDEAQAQITFSGSAEDVAKKNGSLKFVTLEGPLEHWWDYSPAHSIVIAGPISRWTSENRAALEYYGRAGGKLLLLNKEVDDPTFLSAYRETGSSNEPVLIGSGKLSSLPSLESKALGALFAGGSLAALQNPIEVQFYGSNGSLIEWLRDQVGVSFSFPRLSWLLIWLIVYILVVGVANFALLRRLRRLEWGWISTSVVAVAFAIGLYAASSANRPSKVILDNLAVYRMDSHSPVAMEEIGLRISSPERQSITVSVGDGAMFHASNNYYQRALPTAQIAGDITKSRRLQSGWDISMGPSFQTDLALLRWSFDDVNLDTFHVFPGSVTLRSGSYLKNDTGEHFYQALYFDSPNNKRYVIPSLAPGEEIDISRLASEPIAFEHKPEGSSQDVSVVMHSGKDFTIEVRKYSGPAPLRDLANGLPENSAQHVFVGLSDSPVPASNLSVKDFDRRNFALTVVSLD